jgi:hypothetical protein
VSTIADTSDDINDVLGVIVEDVSTLTRHAAIRAAKAARWAWTLGQLVVGGDLAKRKARARRVRIKRERATERRRQAQEFARMERERERVWAKQQSAAAKQQPQTTSATTTERETAGQSPSSPTKQQQQQQPRDTPSEPLTRRRAHGTTPTIQGVIAMAEAVDYETTEAALAAVTSETSALANTLEMLKGGIESAGVGGDTSALLAEAHEYLATSANVLKAAHTMFTRTQGAINELARAAGGVGSNAFHGVG